MPFLGVHLKEHNASLSIWQILNSAAVQKRHKRAPESVSPKSLNCLCFYLKYFYLNVGLNIWVAFEYFLAAFAVDISLPRESPAFPS